MVALSRNVESKEHTNLGGVTVLPEGFYTFAVSDGEMKQSSKGHEMLVLTLTVQSGKEKGDSIDIILNINNPNAKSQKSAWAELETIGKAVSIPNFSDTSEIKGIPFDAKVTVIEGKVKTPQQMNPEYPDSTSFPDSNKVKGYKVAGFYGNHEKPQQGMSKEQAVGRGIRDNNINGGGDPRGNEQPPVNDYGNGNGSPF